MSVNANARFIMASTSEVYGDPSEHPQSESYNGNVNPIGPRSCYDEAKRYSEALCMAYARSRSADVGIVRIFNTYGPRLDPTDGRVVSNFITQALAGQDITIYGDGLQTRSFCYVSDLVGGVIALLDSSELGPINIGNSKENTMLELASTIIELCKSPSRLVFHDLPIDDPTRRKPDIAKAMNLLNWQPRISLEDGLRTTIDWFYQSTI
jgi:dTDP-glucose 4,6-dehydratase